jgi:hypothetical protein
MMFSSTRIREKSMISMEKKDSKVVQEVLAAWTISLACSWAVVEEVAKLKKERLR